MGEAGAIAIVHPFPLAHVAGTTVMLRGLLPEIQATHPGIRIRFLDLDRPDAVTALAGMRVEFDRGLRVVGVNLHIERHRRRSFECYALCRRERVPALLWAHDYWPHLKPSVRAVVDDMAATLMASTRTVRDGLAADGFTAGVVQAGISIANLVDSGAPPPPATSEATTFVVGSAGRLVPRKRFQDVVGAFALAGLAGAARVKLRVSPSLVYGREEDDALLDDLLRQSPDVVVHGEPCTRHDYGAYSVYVCASSYEGFSMTPIEAAWCGCPPLMSDIPAHREIARTLYPDDSSACLFLPGDVDALACLLRDEAGTGRRRAELAARRDDVRRRIEARWSLRRTARELVSAVGFV